jgi:cysteinyl-tRNA synthetase
LGHARSAISFDLLRRVFEYEGYKTIFARNITDIDDKIIKKIQTEGKTLQELTDFYTKRYKDDLAKIGVKEPLIEPKATQNIDAIIEFIDHLMKKDFAYVIDDGVYFDVQKDSGYFSLSHRKMDEKDSQSRVESNSQKKDPKDFALWKFCSDEEIGFDSPWGRGRPGWHIECSAMIKRHLGLKDSNYQIDIHAGGADLLFPHHENEATQSRCESGVELAKYWMHNGFVQIDGEKMSKSLGNSFYLKDALKIYEGEVLRFYLLSTHYRANFNFSEEELLHSKKRLDRLYRLKKRLSSKTSTPNRDFKDSLLEALMDDLNISKALGVIDEMISEANEKLDLNPKDKALKNELGANIALISELLGIGALDHTYYFQIGVDEETKSKITSLIEQRLEAKKRRDFEKADEIRDELLKMDIKIMDTAEGTLWERDLSIG